jgi:hypothetical protein
MNKRTHVRKALTVAICLALATSNLAFAVDEAEAPGAMGVNDSIRTAQPLSFIGSVEINGVIGFADPLAAAIPDVDFYAFEATEGDLLEVDVDAGMHPFADPKLQRSVDTVVVIYGPLPNVTVTRENTNSRAALPLDDGSQHVGDALIRSFRAPRTGTYVVGVSSDPRSFVDGGGTSNTIVSGRSAPFPNGKYKLTISGVTSPVQHINIAIKPGSGEKAPINLKAKGTIPVALLSHRKTDTSEAFDALTVDTSTLTFGGTGDEYSYLRCSKEGLDVDADGLLDLVCHFDNQAAKWQAEDLEGTVKGKTVKGVAFEGSGPLKVLPRKE